MTAAAAAAARADTAAEEEEIARNNNKRDRQPDNDDSDEEAEFDDDDDADDGAAEPMQTDATADDAEADGGSRRQVTPDKRAAKAAAAAAASAAAAVAKGNETVFSPELLRTYYSRLFPHEFLTSWLSYDPPPAGGEKKGSSSSSSSSSSSTSLFARREWSFTIEPTPGDEIYIRYQSFVNPSDLITAISRRNPHKIDIGAVFTHPPKDHNALQGSGKFKTEQRELVFDIDLTDYDGVRHCGCSGAKICNKCWKMMGMAVKVMERGLKDDFGFENVAWFYSGRRGVHAWVCDEGARTLSNEGRSAVASYFEVSMGTEQNKTMNLPHPLHPTLTRSYEILEPMFVTDILPQSGHGLLATEESWTELLATLPKGGEPVAARLTKKWGAAKFNSSPEEKWIEIKRNLSILIGKGGGSTSGGGGGGNKAAKNLTTKERIKLEQWPVETVFRYTYPRLDINVSKMQNHLLKSPFCVHPKTGRVCVPIDVDKVDTFDPFQVPTLPQLMRELDEYDKKTSSSEEEEDNEEEGMDDGEDEGKSKRREKKKVEYEWQKTSLRGPFEHFRKQFLIPMWNDLRRERRAEAEERAAVTGDF